jgi:hypothetical protein
MSRKTIKIEKNKAVLVSSGMGYAFTNVPLSFSNETYENVFACKNNKTLKQTLEGDKYQKFKEKVYAVYPHYLDEKIGIFHYTLKCNGDGYYNEFLNPYGDKRYSKFGISNETYSSKHGLYIYCLNDKVVYIGKTIDSFYKRINQGYGNISPKNCFIDGQSTNCHINSLITNSRDKIKLYVCVLDNNEQICALEKELIHEYNPDWNIQFKL